MEKFSLERIGNKLLTIGVCEENMKCPICREFMQTKNIAAINELLPKYAKKRHSIQIKTKILLNKKNRDFLTFDGIFNLMQILLMPKDEKTIKKIGKMEGVVKIYLLPNHLGVEILLFDDCGEKFISHLEQMDFPNNDISISVEEFIYLSGIIEDVGMLYVPLPVGLGSFRKNKKFKEWGFSDSQLQEMNYFIGLGLKNFKMADILHNKPIFDLEKKMVSKESNGKVAGH